VGVLVGELIFALLAIWRYHRRRSDPGDTGLITEEACLYDNARAIIPMFAPFFLLFMKPEELRRSKLFERFKGNPFRRAIGLHRCNNILFLKVKPGALTFLPSMYRDRTTAGDTLPVAVYQSVII